MKVAQYEVLGNDANRNARPAGTIETFGSSSFTYGLTGASSQSIVPSASGTGHSFRTPTQHFVLGDFHRVPTGPDSVG
jgi:hypothetical protein